jgi:hypothetical protein
VGEGREDTDALPVEGALTDGDPDRPVEGEALPDAEGVALGLGLAGPEAVPREAVPVGEPLDEVE